MNEKFTLRPIKHLFSGTLIWFLALFLEILALLTMPICAQTIYRGVPFTTLYSPQLYHGGIQNWQITQDERGLIYVANNLGLLEFDGYNWKLYPLPNGSKVRSVAIGAKGQIYIAGQNEMGYFFPNELGTLEYHSLTKLLDASYTNFGEAWGIYTSQSGSVYFCTFRYIFEYSNHKIQVIDTKKQLEFSFMVNKQLYVNSPHNGLFLLKKQQLTAISFGNFFKGKRISSIIPFQEGQMFITTFEHGAFVYKDEGISPWEIKLGNKTLQHLNYAIALKDGRIAIGTQSDGLIIINRNKEVQIHLTLGKGLNSRTVLSLYQDTSHNLWAGLNNGIVFVELASPFTLHNEAAGLQGTGYTANLHENNLYFGTNNGVYQYTYQEGISSYESLPNGIGLQTYTIANIGGELLIGTHQGAFALRSGRLQQISPQNGIWNFILLPSTRPEIMLSGHYDGFLYYEKIGNQWVAKGNVEGLKESSRVVVANPEHIWMTHGYKGAFRLTFQANPPRFSEVAFYNQQNGFPTNAFINVFNIKGQNVFTSEKGIFQYDTVQKKIVPFEEYNKIFGKNNHIRYLKEDHAGNLYFIDGSFQVGKVVFDTHKTANIETNLFRKIKGLLNDDLESIIILDHENVLFTAKEGFIHFNPTQPFDAKRTFEVVMRNVISFGDSNQVLFDGNFAINDSLTYYQPNNKVFHLPHRQNSIRFTYSANFYEGHEQLEYQYQLKGFKKEWSEWETKNFKDYTNLPSGKYTFIVRARNVYGTISKEATYRFSIASPWYLSSIAYTFYVIVIIAGYVLVIWFTQYKHETEKEKLVTLQKQELQAKDQQIDAVSRESELAINHLKNEKLRAEIEHKNKELATATMHMVNKNSFISSIKHDLTPLIQKVEKQPSIQSELQKIIKTIDKNLSESNDWEQFQHHFDKVHGDFSKRLAERYPKLTPQERKLAAYLRMNMTSKEIASLMNISVRGVEISRYRLRKKLDLDTSINLTEFILNF
ncbi:MAG: triple tyrosine motif-containing protein [Flammeovirgaceae bacterium]